jgi:cytochrome c-type biogenesis protein CcmH
MRKTSLRASLAAGVLAAALSLSPALAVQPNEVLPDPAQEARARQISENLRCLVCQNQSIDDSNAELARELRVLVREQVKSGKTNDQVTDYLVSRFGEFILLKPPVNLHTALLWGGPFAILALAGVMVLTRARRRAAAAPAVAPLTDEERRRLDAALNEDAPGAST